MANLPTADTPQQRDDKAAALKEQREVTAADLARAQRAFQWEVRFYIGASILYVLLAK